MKESARRKRHLALLFRDADAVPEPSARTVAWNSLWSPGAEPGNVDNGRPPAGILIEEEIGGLWDS